MSEPDNARQADTRAMQLPDAALPESTLNAPVTPITPISAATPATQGPAIAAPVAEAAPADDDPAARAERARLATERHRRRKWWMVLQQLAFPGYAQLRRGPHALGWLGLAATVAWWGTLATLVVLAVTRREAVFEAFTNPGKLTFVIGALLAIAAICLATGVAGVMRTQRGRKRPAKIIAGGLIGAIALGQCAVLGYGAFALAGTRQVMASAFAAAVPAGQVTAAGAHAAERSGGVAVTAGRVNILMLGGDAGTGRWGLRPDSISVLSVDQRSGRSVLIGLPRNLERVPFAKDSPLWGPFPDGYDCGDQCLLNALYTYASGHSELYSGAQYAGSDPGMLATRDAVEGVTGLTISYMVLIDMSGFADIVDAAGGVTVTVPKDTLAQDGKTTFRKGTQHMDGAQALLYSRTRYDSDDYGRMAKQRLIQQALLQQANPATLMTSYVSLMQAGARYVHTDIPQSDLPGLASLALTVRSAGVSNLELVPPAVNVAHPDFPAIRQMVTAALTSAP